MATNPKSIIPNIRVSLGKPVSVPCAVMCESQQTTARLVGRRGSSAVVVGGRFSTAVVVITRRPRGVGCYGSREWDVSGDVSVWTVFVAHIAGDGGLCKKWSNPSILAGGQVLRRAVVAVGYYAVTIAALAKLLQPPTGNELNPLPSDAKTNRSLTR